MQQQIDSVEKLAETMFGSGSSTFANHFRNIHITHPDGVTVEYRVTIVIRQPDWLIESASSKEEVQEIIKNQLAVSMERTWFWTEMAGLFYRGGDMDDELLQEWEHTMPRRIDATPNVTVFGVIVDAEGRNFSLTITDQSNPRHIADILNLNKVLYDTVTELGTPVGGKYVDRNSWGAGKRWIVVRKPTASKKKKTTTTSKKTKTTKQSSTPPPTPGKK